MIEEEIIDKILYEGIEDEEREEIENAILSFSNKGLKKLIEEYNWDDGFRIPTLIKNNSNCDLKMALELFDLADGYTYLEDKEGFEENNNEYFKDFYNYVIELYNEIISGKFGAYDVNKLTTAKMGRVQEFKYNKARQAGLISEVDRIFYESLED